MLYTGGLTTVCFILSSAPLQLKLSYPSIIIKLTCVANKSYYFKTKIGDRVNYNRKTYLICHRKQNEKKARLIIALSDPTLHTPYFKSTVLDEKFCPPNIKNKIH